MRCIKDRLAALMALVSDTGGTPDRKIVSRRANTGRVLKDALWYIEHLEERAREYQEKEVRDVRGG